MLRAAELLDRVNEAGKRDVLRGNNMMVLGFSLDCPQKEWPDPSMSKDGLIKQIEAEVKKLPGNKMGFSQPIEM